MITDPIADMLTRIRNAQKAEKVSVLIPASRMKRAILEILREEGYIERLAEQEVDSKAMLEVFLKYYAGKPVIEKLQRVSRPRAGVCTRVKTSSIQWKAGSVSLSYRPPKASCQTAQRARQESVVRFCVLFLNGPEQCRE